MQLAALLGFFLAIPATVLAEEDLAPYVPLPNPTNDYLDAIDRIEGELGPYATELSDLYLGLGQSLLDKGELERARDAFNRGVMVVRVNSGPNSPEQTNHLYLIANLEAALGNNNEADEVLHNIYFINKDHFGENSTELLPILERMYQWYNLTRPLSSDDAEYDDFERRIDLAEEMAEINEAAHGPESPDMAESYRRVGEAQLELVRFLMGEGLTLSVDAYVVVTNTRMLDSEDVDKTSIGSHYESGRRVFNKYLALVDADETMTPKDKAQAHAEVGDWYLAVGKSRSARDQYRQAYEILSGSEQFAELAQDYMAHPAPVYFFQPPPDFLQDREDPLPGMDLDISMTVTSFGDVRDAEILNAPEELPEDVAGDILRLVRGTPFRPAAKEGETVTTKDFIWRFAILPPENAS